MADDETLERLDARLAEVERRLGTHTEVWEGIKLDMRQRKERRIRVYRDVQASNERMWARADDLAEESRAQRQALLALIDRPPPSRPGGA